MNIFSCFSCWQFSPMVRAERHWHLCPSVSKWQGDRGGWQRPGLLCRMVPVEELHGERGNVNLGDFFQAASY